MEARIEMTGVSAGYGGVAVIRGMSVSVREGDFVLISGANGSGKTTAVKVLAGLLRPMKGEVRRQKGLKVGYVPQVSEIDRRFPVLVEDMIYSGLMNEKGRREKKTRVEGMLREMGLAGIERKGIGELSGGQLQRALLGRALVSKPEVLILDEPESHLDAGFEGRLGEILRGMGGGTSIVLVSHKGEWARGMITKEMKIEGNVRI
jgi:zinc transport system ATP-binding protein